MNLIKIRSDRVLNRMVTNSSAKAASQIGGVECRCVTTGPQICDGYYWQCDGPFIRCRC